MEKRYFYKILLITGIFLIIIGLINYIIDPQQQYRYNPKFYKGEQRIVNIGLAINYNYNTVIIGSSTSENILKKDVDTLFKTDSINLSLSGSTSYEQRILLNEIIDNENCNLIIYGLDFFTYTREIYEKRKELPNYVFGNKLKYLYNISVLKDSAIIILKEILRKNSKNWLNNYSYWGNNYSYSKENTINYDKKTQYGNQNIGMTKVAINGYDYIKMKNNFDEFLKIVRKNSNIKYKIYFLPYSSLYWYIVDRYNNLENILEFKEYIIKKSLKEKNIELYDFQSELEIINNLDNYKDGVHFGPFINKYMIEKISKNENKITLENYKENERILRKNIEITKREYNNLLSNILKKLEN